MLATREGHVDVVKNLLNMCGSWWPLGRTNKQLVNNNGEKALSIAQAQQREAQTSDNRIEILSLLQSMFVL